MSNTQFRQYFQNLAPENPRNKLSKIVVNEQLKFLNSIQVQGFVEAGLRGFPDKLVMNSANMTLRAQDNTLDLNLI